MDYSTLCIVGVATTGLMLLYQLAYKTKFERKLEAEDKKRIYYMTHHLIALRKQQYYLMDSECLLNVIEKI